ncbi:YdgA family protein [Pseudomonas fluorescens]|uniref:Protein YdgA n=1 Tax=Pseudomonas fluorescens TaxID=294 RepID=A0A5E7AIA8_PSEFL|nr:YdgA family protein [Pseudomonas fluorescens]VVN78175.1 Protein YdgA [Pseudomonas fluorescens]
MNKSAGVLLAIVVAVGAISAGGAWYTGTKLEGVLQTSIADANTELQTALVGSKGNATLELVSLDRRLFSSTAHYRLKGQGEMFTDRPEGVELLFVDHIEHGPLPFSRLIALKWLPVLATSHYELEKTPLTEKWFAATQGAAPVKGVVNIGYDNSTNSKLELLPLEVALDEKSNLKFSGLNLDVDASAKAQQVKAKGYMDSLTLSTVAEDQTPVLIELNGLTMASNLDKSSYGYYLGQNTLELTSTKTTFGEKQAVVTFKNAELKSSTHESGTNAAGRADYKVGEILYNGKAVGAANMAWSLKNLDIPATLSLVQVYQSKLQPYEAAAAAAAAAGEPAPELMLSEAEQAQVKTDLEKLLDAKPQIAMENLSFKTANGESRMSLVVDLARPQSMDLPPVEVGKQLIALLDFNLLMSKPMIADVASVQAQIEGQTDAKVIAEQATMASDMVSSMAVGTQLATLDGNNIVSKLRYANNQVDFNGQKMTVEQFIGFVMNTLGGAGAVQ